MQAKRPALLLEKPSKAGRVTVFGRAAPDRAGARPYRRNGIA